MARNVLLRCAATLIAGCSLLGGLAAHAAESESKNPAAKYRHEVMEAMGHHMAAIAAVFTGRVEAPGHLEVHTDALAKSATLIGSLFPPGSEGGHALPLVWEEPEEVAKAAKDAAESTAALAEAAASGDRGATAKALKAAGDGCKGCHERYKEEDEH